MRNDRRHSKSGSTKIDPRSDAARDRDRVLYSEPLRRLLGVTQVVGAHEVIFHNRLTHSLKVAQIAGRLAEKVVAEFAETERSDELQDLGGLDREVTEAAALAHDLGHPPFGHAGEVVLDELTRAYGCLEGFEGNAQSFRIVTKLAFRSPDPAAPPGLDLTRATLRAMLKYPWPRKLDPSGKPDASTKKGRKWGYYETEADDFAFAKTLPPSGTDCRSLEAEIMDWADDITYAIHDLEDFYRAGLIPFPSLVFDSSARDEFISLAAKNIEAPESKVAETFDSVRVLVPSAPFTGAPRELGGLAVMRNQLITVLMNAFQVTPGGTPVAIVTEDERRLADVLKQLTWIYVISTTNLETQQFGQKKVITEIFDAYCSTDSSGRERKSHEHLDLGFPNGVASDGSTPARCAADFVSGLTETQALQLYGRLTGHRPGSVRDMLK